MTHYFEVQSSINDNNSIVEILQYDTNNITINEIGLSNFLKYQTINNSDEPGSVGSICYDDNYLYICVSNNSWKRINYDNW